MSFIAPLAFALGLLAIPIIALYMLRLRRREVQVSSTLLWQQLLRDREANAPWQKLRRNLLLLLQLLILAGLIFALARPFIEVPTVSTGRIALLIDASASMNATDVQPRRFEEARKQARSIIDSLNSQDSVAIIRVAEQPEVLETYTNDTNSLRAALDRAQPSMGSADWNAALTLAAAGAIGADKFTIILISDGGVPANLAASYGSVKFIPIGIADANMAISALATATDPVSGPQIYARLTNYGTQAADIVFSVTLDDKLFNASTYNVPANGTTDVVVTGLPKTFRRVQANLTRPASSTAPDYLALDDSAWTIYNPVTAGRALLMTQQNRFLTEGFANLPDWQMIQGSPDKGLPGDTYDLYVFDGWLPPTLPDANMLIINPPASTSLFTVGPVIKTAQSFAVLADDPRTRYLKFNDINIREYETLSSTVLTDMLVKVDGNPLILAGQYNSHRVAVLSFDLHNSDLGIKIPWPILLSNLTEWYKAPRAISLGGSLQPGQTVTIQPRTDAQTVRVQRPDGAITTFKVDQPLLIYADTPMPGIYTVDVYKGSDVIQEEYFAVNLFDPNESQIAVRTPAFSTSSLATGDSKEIGQREFWPYIALAALAILILEWYAYHRRLKVPRLSALRRFARRS